MILPHNGTQPLLADGRVLHVFDRLVHHVRVIGHVHDLTDALKRNIEGIEKLRVSIDRHDEYLALRGGLQAQDLGLQRRVRGVIANLVRPHADEGVGLHKVEGVDEAGKGELPAARVGVPGLHSAPEQIGLVGA